MQIILAITGFMLGIGFAIGTGNNSNYDMLMQFAGNRVWSLLFLCYSITKFVGAFYRIPTTLRYATNIIGLWAWNYIFLSFTIFDPTPIAPTEILLAVPIAVEVWTMISASVKGTMRHRRTSDAR